MDRLGVEVICGDITDRDAVRRATAGVDAVVHLAATLHKTNVSPAIRQEYADVNIGGTENIITSARAKGVSRVIFASTIAVYGYSRGAVLDEASTIEPDTDYARSKAEAESLVRRASGVVLRFGAIYGPRAKGNYHHLVTSLARKRFLPIGRGQNRRSVVYDSDAAGAVVAALHAPRAAGETYNVAHRHAPTVAEIIEAMCAALGRTPPRIRIPQVAARVPIALIETVLKSFGFQPPVTRTMLEKYLEDVVVSPEKIRREVGFVARYDIDAGWAAAVQAMRAAGQL